MTSQINNYHSNLAPNRSDEYPDDVWDQYVIPPIFENLDLFTSKKPRVIIGGRGSGKTMLLKYLSHKSWFSQLRKSITPKDLNHIGIYWRVQNPIVSTMNERGLTKDQWSIAFEHFTAIELSIQVLDALKSIFNYKEDLVQQKTLDELTFKKLKDYSESFPEVYKDLYENFFKRRREYEYWLNNIKKVGEPEYLPGYQFIRELINIILNQIPALKDSTYYIYIDEYENLLEYQQIIINTWLKHSVAPLIANLAVKRNAFSIRKTLSDEQLVDIHDFRTYDLESYHHSKNDFEVFAAEIILQRFQSQGLHKLPVNDIDLRDYESLSLRRNSEYRRKVNSTIKKIFPSITTQNISSDVFNDKVLFKALNKQLMNALKRRGKKPIYKPKDFILLNSPAASIVTASLLYRPKLKVNEILSELDNYGKEGKGRFKGNGGWIANNLVGSLLLLYEPLNRACPIYSGFETFCQLSKGNIRHLLELCYRSLLINDSNIQEDLPYVSPNKQAEAARQVSATLLHEIRMFGRHGNRLYSFILRLGSLFKILQLNPAQSEPEQNHFSIIGGRSKLIDEDYQFLNECVKWSVLFEEKQTKKKHRYQQETIEYVLNPIYSPYFHISYRKRKKIELTTDQYISLSKGSYQEFQKLLSFYTNKWSINTSETSLPLFSEIKS